MEARKVARSLGRLLAACDIIYTLTSSIRPSVPPSVRPSASLRPSSVPPSPLPSWWMRSCGGWRAEERRRQALSPFLRFRQQPVRPIDRPPLPKWFGPPAPTLSLSLSLSHSLPLSSRCCSLVLRPPLTRPPRPPPQLTPWPAAAVKSAPLWRPPRLPRPPGWQIMRFPAPRVCRAAVVGRNVRRLLRRQVKREQPTRFFSKTSNVHSNNPPPLFGRSVVITCSIHIHIFKSHLYLYCAPLHRLASCDDAKWNQKI